MSDINRREVIEYAKEKRHELIEFWEDYKHENREVKYYDFIINSLETEEAYQLEYEQPEICENCIDSEYLIRDLYCKANGETSINIHWLEGYIKKLPSVLPKAKKGHWIEHEFEGMREKGYYRCSVCNHGYQRYVKGIRKSDVPYIDGQEYILWNNDNYCPNCGAKMVEP